MARRPSDLKTATRWQRPLAAALLLSALSAPTLAADPVLSITATPNPAVQGSNVSLDVLISGINDLYGYQFSLSFDPKILQASSVSEGSFLSSGGGNTFADGGTIDNSLGTVSFIFNSLVGAVPGVSGSGNLARINFNVTGAGSSALNFSDALFLNSSLTDLPVQIQNGSLQALPVPEPASYLMLMAGLTGLAAVRRRASRPAASEPAPVQPAGITQLP